jgi:hypothetical protein
MRLFAAGCRKLGLRNRQIKAGENQRRISASSTQLWRAAATLQRWLGATQMAWCNIRLPGPWRCWRGNCYRVAINRRIRRGWPSESAFGAGGGRQARGLRRGGAVHGGTGKGRSTVLSIASSALYLAPRPLCRLTLPPLQVPLAPQKPLAPVKLRAPPPTARRPQLRQNCQHHCAPGPAWIFSVPSRPAAA